MPQAGEPGDEREAPRVRVVVLNHNGGDDVLRCLTALEQTEWPARSLELVVVDNASTDGSIEKIAASHPDATIIPVGANRGFPANNLALRDLSTVNFVALVNNDAFVEPGWLAPLVDELESDGR